MKTLCRVGRKGIGRGMKWQKHQILPSQSFCPVHFSDFPKTGPNDPEYFSSYPKNFWVVNVKVENFSGKFSLKSDVILSQSDAGVRFAGQVLRKSFTMSILRKKRHLFSPGESDRIQPIWLRFALTRRRVRACSGKNDTHPFSYSRRMEFKQG